MHFKTIILWGALGLAGCAEPWQLCQSIELGTPAKELPLANSQPWFGVGNELRGPAKDLECCHLCGLGKINCDSCKVDCTEPALQATPFEVGDAYAGKCGSEPGAYHCTAWVRDDEVVATKGFCAN